MENVQAALKKCPYCGEEIMESAVKCKHCNEFLYKRAKPFSFKGRIRRKEHNWSLLLSLVSATIIAGLLETESEAEMIVAFLLFVVTLWFYCAQTVKRMHDIGWSGWWVIPNFLIPVVWVVSEIYLIFFKGEIGPNKFGPAPFLD